MEIPVENCASFLLCSFCDGYTEGSGKEMKTILDKAKIIKLKKEGLSSRKIEKLMVYQEILSIRFGGAIRTI